VQVQFDYPDAGRLLDVAQALAWKTSKTNPFGPVLDTRIAARVPPVVQLGGESLGP
jgi:hypothetical protein